MNISGVPATEYPELAHLIRPFLEKFTGDGANTVEDFESRIMSRDMQCFIGGDGALKVVCLTEIVPDRLKTCHVSFCGGEDFREWVPLIEEICRFAKEIGCGKVRVTARPGYEKFLTQHSFRKTHIVMDRIL